MTEPAEHTDNQPTTRQYPSAPAEEQIVLRARTGDLEAIGDLLEFHGRGLRGVLRFLCFSYHVAPGDMSDLEQHAWISIWKGLSRGGFAWQGQGSFMAWAVRIVQRLAARFSTRTFRVRLETNAEDIVSTLPGGDPDPAAVFESRATLEDVHNIIEEVVGAKAATALRRHALDGVPLEVAAREVGTKRTTVTMQLKRNRQELRRALQAAGLLLRSLDEEKNVPHEERADTEPKSNQHTQEQRHA